MKRRDFLATAATGAAATGLAAPVYAQGNRTLTMVTSWGRGLAGVHDSAQYVADSISTMSDGALTVDLRAAGELVGAFENFDAVTAGQADMYHSSDYYFAGQHPAFTFFSTVPFGMTAQELNNWYYHGDGQDLHNELGSIFGLKPFLVGNTGPQSGGWFNREITGVEDFQGLRFRMPGQGAEVLGKLGASVQNLPGSEVYQALSSGAIDGTEWIGPWADEAAGFHEITKYYYTAGFHEPGPGLTLGVNLSVFEELSPAHQKIIEQAALATNMWTLTLFMKNNAAALSRLGQQGVQIMEFPEDVWEAFGTASKEVLQQHASDPLYASILASYQESMRENSTWIGQTERVYAQQRDRILGL